MGASQNSHSCSMAHPPANSAGPVLRAGLTEVLVTGMLIGCISVCTSGAGRAREVLGHCAGLFERVVVRLRHVRALRLVIEGA